MRLLVGRGADVHGVAARRGSRHLDDRGCSAHVGGGGGEDGHRSRSQVVLGLETHGCSRRALGCARHYARCAFGRGRIGGEKIETRQARRQQQCCDGNSANEGRQGHVKLWTMDCSALLSCSSAPTSGGRIGSGAPAGQVWGRACKCAHATLRAPLEATNVLRTP